MVTISPAKGGIFAARRWLTTQPATGVPIMEGRASMVTVVTRPEGAEVTLARVATGPTSALLHPESLALTRLSAAEAASRSNSPSASTLWLVAAGTSRAGRGPAGACTGGGGSTGAFA